MPITRKIYKAGHSYVVSLPTYILDHLSVSPGDHLTFDIPENGALRLFRSSIHEIEKGHDLDQDLYRLTARLIYQNRPP